MNNNLPSIDQLKTLQQEQAKYPTCSGSDKGIVARVLDNYRRTWARLAERYHNLVAMEEEGIVEITLRTGTGQTLTVPVTQHLSTTLAVALWEHTGKQISRQEALIIEQSIELKSEMEDTPSDSTELSIRLHQLCSPDGMEVAPEVPTIPLVPRQPRRRAQEAERKAAS